MRSGCLSLFAGWCVPYNSPDAHPCQPPAAAPAALRRELPAQTFVLCRTQCARGRAEAYPAHLTRAFPAEPACHTRVTVASQQISLHRRGHSACWNCVGMEDGRARSLSASLFPPRHSRQTQFRRPPNPLRNPRPTRLCASSPAPLRSANAATHSSHHIILNVLVTDASGKPVTGLNQSDFTLLDNGQPQKITSFRPLSANAEGQPLHVILLFDAVNNSARNYAASARRPRNFSLQVMDRSPGPWPSRISPISEPA